MRSVIYFAVSAFAAVAAAASDDNAFKVPPSGYNFAAGVPTTVSWDPTTTGTITLKLHDPSDITPSSGTVLAASVPNSGSFSWTPPSNLDPGRTYVLEIVDDANPTDYNFTPSFSVSGGTASASASTATATTTSSASTASSTDSSSTESTTKTKTGTTTTTSSATTLSTSTSSSSSGSSSSAASTSSEATTTSASSSSTRTSSASPSAQSTTAPGAASAIGISGGMFAIVAGAMAVL